MELIKIVTIELAILLFWFNADYTICATKNDFLLERVICPENKTSSAVQSPYCNVRYIDRYRNIKFNIHVNITKPLKDLWFHSVFYYKFNGLVYQKFPVDLWENFCEWQAARLAGKPTMMYTLDWTFGTIIHNSNINHSCPLFGYYALEAKNLSMDDFIVKPLFPSGRYRLDVYFTGNDRIPLFEGHVYYSISDYRLEKI